MIGDLEIFLKINTLIPSSESRVLLNGIKQERQINCYLIILKNIGILLRLGKGTPLKLGKGTTEIRERTGLEEGLPRRLEKGIPPEIREGDTC